MSNKPTQDSLRVQAKKIEQVYLEYAAKLDKLISDYKEKMRTIIRGAEQKKIEKLQERIKNT